MEWSPANHSLTDFHTYPHQSPAVIVKFGHWECIPFMPLSSFAIVLLSFQGWTTLECLRYIPLPVTQFSYLENGDNNGTDSTELWQKAPNEVTCVNKAQGLAWSECVINIWGCGVVISSWVDVPRCWPHSGRRETASPSAPPLLPTRMGVPGNQPSALSCPSSHTSAPKRLRLIIELRG